MEEDIIEKLADNEHNRWSNWQKYVHSKCIKNQDGSLTIPKEYVEHWEYEINTKYKDLPENIKESDRKEVRQILEMLDFDYLIAKYKELEKHYQHEQEYINGEVFSAKQMHYIEDNYIDKSKVKEKIEEIDKQGDTPHVKDMSYRTKKGFVIYKEHAIRIIEELLEE